MTEPVYVLGHSAAELDRLRHQGAIFEDITRDAFAAAGISSGCRVLDIGCGAGDVSFLVADIVGEAGSVVGVDRSPEAIAAARARARAGSRSPVDFRVGAIDVFQDPHGFDAVVGRFVLMHQADAGAVLRAVTNNLRPGGVIVMIESAFSACVPGFHSTPHSAAYDQMLRLMTRVIRAAGADAGMGLRLRDVFARAGLPEPTIRLQARVESGASATIHRYLADSLRIVAPSAATLGVADCTGGVIDALETQLHHDLAGRDATIVSPPIVAAWSRIPAAVP